MGYVVPLTPTTNYALADASERSDQMVSFSRVLQGLNQPAQFLSQAREVDLSELGWPKLPKVERWWSASVRTSAKSFISALDGMGIHCGEAENNPSVGETIVKATADAVQLDNGDWCAGLVLRRWPREVAPGWLGHAISGLDFPVDVAIHVQPQDPLRLARFLRKQQTWQSDTGPTKDAANTLGRTDAERVREKLVARTDRPCKVAVVMTVRARDLAQLRERVDGVKGEMGLALADVRETKFEHDRAWLATQPNSECTLVGAWRTLDCTSVASTWIYQPVAVSHANGAKIGVTHSGDMLVALDPFDPSLEGFSGVVIGKKRMGKSYFMKIMARAQARRGVEVTIIEQRRPAEYAVLASEPNIRIVNVEEVANDTDEPSVAAAKRVQFLRSFLIEYWNTCRANPRPRMLIIDEGWALLRAAQLADWVEEVARTCGHFGLSFWLLTQQVRELLETGRAVLDNTEIMVFLKQLNEDLGDLARAVGMPTPARQWLRAASRGQVLLNVGGLWIATDVARVPEHYEISTDPRDLWRSIDNANAGVDDALEDASHEDDDSREDRRADWRVGSVRLGGSGRSGSDPAPVAAARQ